MELLDPIADALLKAKAVIVGEKAGKCGDHKA